MDVVVVGRRTEQRWRVAAQLGRRDSVSWPPALAASRLAHPSTTAPDAVVLLVADWVDLAWLETHRARIPSRHVPVVAVLERPALHNAARAAGAAATVVVGADGIPATDELVAAVRDVCEPALVLDLASARATV